MRIGGLFSIFLMVQPWITAQTLPELTFRNIRVWNENRGVIRILEDAEGFLWMTSAVGVHRYDGLRIHSYYHQQSDSTSISGNYTEMLFEDDQHRIWVGNTEGGLDRYNRAEDQFTRVVDRSAGMGHLCRMIQDAAGKYWIAAANGLYAMDPRDYHLTQYRPGSAPRDRAYGFRGLALDIRDPGGLWVVGLDGAYHFEQNTGTFTDLHVPVRADGKQYMLMDVHQTSAHLLRSASWPGGIMSYNLTERTWNRAIPPDPADGRWYDVLKAILPFDEQRIWVAGGAGFGVYLTDQQAFAFYPFHQGEHPIDSSFSYAGITMTRQGCVVVSGLRGVSISSSVDTGTSLLYYPPVMASIEIDGKAYAGDSSVTYLGYLELDDSSKDISFTLTTPGNYLHDHVQYRFWLEGYDNDWQTPQDDPSVRYTNLPAGGYVLRYGARNGDQEWLEGRPVNIEKTMPIVKSPWFYTVVIFLLIAMLYLAYRVRIQQVKAGWLRAEYNRKLADIEMALLRSQMNPHFIFNSLNSIRYYILNEDPESANKYLTKFSKLMRLVLKNSQARFIYLKDELDALRLYIELEALRFKQVFEYYIHVSEEIDEEGTFVPPLIIQPYVENAIWHGLLQKQGPGHLKVAIHVRERFVQIEIIDDGIGREAAEALKSKSAARKSFGSRMTRDRISLVREIIGVQADVHTTDLYDTEGNPSGTQVLIEIPLITEEKMSEFQISE